ncbi:MAG: HYR domain-containing protein, partial [Saprospiraceae bacterium]|nr:HYR domain-containing protein [Saprospiraceae bacterium]
MKQNLLSAKTSIQDLMNKSFRTNVYCVVSVLFLCIFSFDSALACDCDVVPTTPTQVNGPGSNEITLGASKAYPYTCGSYCYGIAIEIRPVGVAFSNTPTHYGPPIVDLADAPYAPLVLDLTTLVPGEYKWQFTQESDNCSNYPNGNCGGTSTSWWTDSGFTFFSCSSGTDADGDGWVSDCDCDDSDPAVNPDATEVCGNGIDDDCDGDVDTDDDDMDGVSVCAGDCDDNNPLVYPDAPEICDGIDNNCDGMVESSAPYLVGLSGMNLTNNCGGSGGYYNSNMASITWASTDATMASGSITLDIGVNCMTSSIDISLNGSPWTTINPGYDCTCTPSPNSNLIVLPLDPSLYISNGLNTITFSNNDAFGFQELLEFGPGVFAALCVDYCDNTLGVDSDGDGWLDGGCDCDDTNPNINPLAPEICNGLDDDCDSLIDELDLDKDGFPICVDCDDSNPFVYPGAPEICDGLDNDCDGIVESSFTYDISAGFINFDGNCGNVTQQYVCNGSDLTLSWTSFNSSILNGTIEFAIGYNCSTGPRDVYLNGVLQQTIDPAYDCNCTDSPETFIITLNPADYNAPGNNTLIIEANNTCLGLHELPQYGVGVFANVCVDYAAAMGSCPIITDCPTDNEVSVDETCMAGLPDYTAELEVDASCGPFTVSQDPAPGTMYTAEDMIAVTLTATDDGSGEMNSCMFMVAFIDNIAPTITCPADITQTADGGASTFEGIYPPPGGVDFSSSGGSAGDAGGVTFSYANFDPSAYATLFWGPATFDAVQAGLSGVLSPMTFDNISGSVATWLGSSTWTNPTTGTVSTIPICFSLTLTTGSWTPDPTVGALFEIVGGADFSVTLEFLADLGSGCDTPLNEVQQASAGLTVSSFSGGFFGTTAGAGTGMCGALVTFDDPMVDDNCTLPMGMVGPLNFTTAGASGPFGPNQSQVDAAYFGSELEGQVTINTQGIQEWIVPITGTYSINAIGASGGDGTEDALNFGGLGADLYGEFSLSAGQVIKVIVGQEGETASGGGGGGGSFIWIDGAALPLIVAGGGGGAGDHNQGGNPDGVNASYTNVGTATADGNGGIATGGNGGGTSGSGGASGGGGGWLTDGAEGIPNTRGRGVPNGSIGGQEGQDGGFGGGGSNRAECCAEGGGGGGGYSGGAGADSSRDEGGGGGGSFNAGGNPVNGSLNAGNGLVVIELIDGGANALTQTAGLPSGSIFPVGTTTNTFVVTDQAGNTAMCSFDVTITDDEAPTVDCSGLAISIMTSAGGTGDCVGEYDWAIPTPMDNCGVTNYTVTYTNPDGTIDGPHDAFPYTPENTANSGAPINMANRNFELGMTTVTYYVEDAAGNTGSCSFTVTVTDDEAPTYTYCPNNFIVSNSVDLCGGVVDWTGPLGEDNCEVVSITRTDTGPAQGTLWDPGVYIVTYDLSDGVNPVVECSFTVTVTDNQLPQVSCPSNMVVVTTDLDVCTWTSDVKVDPNFSDDNCDFTLTHEISGATVVAAGTAGSAMGTVFELGMSTVCYTVTEDANGNQTSTCCFDVMVVDEQAPTIVCPNDITQTADPMMCGAVVTFDDPVVDDNCDLAGTSSVISGGLGAIMTGTYSVTPGDILKILVGGEGTSSNPTFTTFSQEGGGGGGTFVSTLGNSPLIVAGGGGGATNNVSQCGDLNDLAGLDASLTTTGTSTATGSAAGGASGNAGSNGGGNGGSGSGFFGDGVGCGAGQSFVNGGSGGQCGSGWSSGGFGGGGGGWAYGGGGGGGGGYSGGGFGGSFPYPGGGGGGSFNAGTSQLSSVGNTGNGLITISYSSGFITFPYSGVIENWTVPTGVTEITIQARGAQGGSVNADS